MEQKSVGVAEWFHMPYRQTKPEDLRPHLPVTNWAPHDLRRSCRTQLAILGCTEEVAEVVLGHMKKGVVGVYTGMHATRSAESGWAGSVPTWRLCDTCCTHDYQKLVKQFGMQPFMSRGGIAMTTRPWKASGVA